MQTESTAVTTTEATHIDQHPVAVYLAGVAECLGRVVIPSALKKVATVRGVLKACWRLGLMCPPNLLA